MLATVTITGLILIPLIRLNVLGLIPDKNSTVGLFTTFY
jgi:hypothetical protein